MQIRVVRLNSRNPLVAILLIALVLAILAVVLTAGMALAVGGAVLGAVGYLARRVLGGKALRAGPVMVERERGVLLGKEVFPPTDTHEVRAETLTVASPDVRRLQGPEA